MKTKSVKTPTVPKLPTGLRATLDDIMLLESSLSRISPQQQPIGPYTLHMNYDKGQVRADQDSLYVEAMCQVKSVAEESIEVFKIDVKFLLTYSFDNVLPTGQDLEDFLDSIVKFNAWPYIREYVQSSSLRMQFNPPPLPLLRSLPMSRITPLKKKRAPKPPTS